MTEINEFAIATGIEQEWLNNHLQIIPDEERLAYLNILKIQYVNDCIIGKSTIQEFQTHHDKAGVIARRLQESVPHHDMVLPFLIVNNRTEQIERYERIISMVSQRNRLIVSQLLDKFIKKYVIDELSNI